MGNRVGGGYWWLAVRNWGSNCSSREKQPLSELSETSEHRQSPGQRRKSIFKITSSRTVPVISLTDIESVEAQKERYTCHVHREAIGHD